MSIVGVVPRKRRGEMKRTLYQMWVLFWLITVWSLASEAFFTGVADTIRDFFAGRPFDSNLPCRTSLWSIPVYGISAAVAFTAVDLINPNFFNWAWWKRGLVYAFCTFGFEFSWGAFLEELTGTCPWLYRDSPYLALRYIKPEYFGLWFLFGFSLERIKVNILPRMLKKDVRESP